MDVCADSNSWQNTASGCWETPDWQRCSGMIILGPPPSLLITSNAKLVSLNTALSFQRDSLTER